MLPGRLFPEKAQLRPGQPEGGRSGRLGWGAAHIVLWMDPESYPFLLVTLEPPQTVPGRRPVSLAVAVLRGQIRALFPTSVFTSIIGECCKSSYLVGVW